MNHRGVVGAWWLSVTVVVVLEALIFVHAMLKLHVGIDAPLLPPLIVQQLLGGVALIAVVALPLLGLGRRGSARPSE